MAFSAAAALDVATEIGRNLCDAAIWRDETCTWEIVTPKQGRLFERKPLRKSADGSLYQGTAGIALFLGELCNHVPNLDFLRTARGAIAHALAQPVSPTFSFHNGVIGTAYVLNRFQQLGVLGSRWEQIDALLQPLIGQRDVGIDVIAGAAGAIPVLLQLAHDAPERDYLFAMAKNLGDQLIETARREPQGWSWGSAPNHVRNLLGMAHGAAGIGRALLELFIVTGETRYRYAATCAFNYEQNLYDKDNQNWPDFRHATLGEYTFSGQLDALRERVRAQTLPAFAPQNMSAWCHGAPGVGLSRLRAYVLTGETQWYEQAVDALQATRRSLHLPLSNYSLCHGMTGNAETLLHGARLLEQPRWLGTVHAVAAFGMQSYHQTDNAWPCGTIDSMEDPSLMLGTAGIGLFYLRLADENIPTPLLLEVPHKRMPLVEHAEELRWEQIESYFGRILPELSTPYSLPETLHNQTDLQYAYDWLRTEAKQNPAVAEAGKVDFAYYEMMLEMTDLTAAWLRELARVPSAEVTWDSAHFTLAPEVRLVETSLNGEPNYFLLHRIRNEIARRPIQLFLFALLSQLAQPKSVSQLVSLFSEMIADDEQRLLLTRKIVQQLQQLYSVGVIELGDIPSPNQPSHTTV